MRTYRDLDAWKEARNLCIMIYKLTESLPDVEIYGLTSQMRRAVVSIASNIAEGYGREGAKEYIRFLHIACGSAYELETQIILCHDLGYINKAQALEVYNKNTVVIKLLRGLIRSLARRQGVSLKEQGQVYGRDTELPF